MKRAQIKRLLPAVFQRVAEDGTPLIAALDVMQAMHAPVETTLGQLESIFDPRRTPKEFVPFLAGWVDLSLLLDATGTGGSTSAMSLSSVGIGRLRELTATAAKLSEWRGTRKGLQLFLQTATGMSGFVIDEHPAGLGGRVKPFHIRVKAPLELSEHRPLIERIIELEKPAYVTYELEF